MITLVKFTNNDSDTVEFNKDLLAYGIGDLHLPLHKFTTSSTIRTTKRTRPQDHGVFPSFTMIGEGSVHIEGSVLYENGQDTIAAIQTVKSVLFGDPTAVPVIDRQMGELEVTLDLASPTTYSTPDGCTISDYSFDIDDSNPSVVPFMITFTCYRPYLLSAGNDVFWL